MYTSIEKAQTYGPVFPEVTKAKKNIAGTARRIMTAALGTRIYGTDSSPQSLRALLLPLLHANFCIGREPHLAERTQRAELRQRRPAGE